MEILISILVGAVLMEAYAWLDPFAKWLVRRATKHLPEDNREAYFEQFLADVEAMPHSLAKIVFALRNCTFATTEIRQEILRSKFELLALESDQIVDQTRSDLQEVTRKFNDVLQRSAAVRSKFAPALSANLERLKKNRTGKELQAAIERADALREPVAEKLSDYHSRIEQNFAKLELLKMSLLVPLARMEAASVCVKRRLLDGTPIGDEDLELLKGLSATLTEIDAVYETVPTGITNVEFAHDTLASIHAAVEAFRAAEQIAKKH